MAMRISRSSQRVRKIEWIRADGDDATIDPVLPSLIMKERAKKLEYWRMRQMKIEEKKELLHRQSSVWVDELELEKKTLEAIVGITTQ
ncbi:Hypothetical predicted protein [Olea europaea subsp. europaea]|uniref:Uncharacterized protein n=1 Tax=Olea europaea subsp. europaea TaxID=158383 RepID=A0A8S0QW44_OLEEU|nr:Hypothetical predicted protein [Olea europaea subsp. europaea]